MIRGGAGRGVAAAAGVGIVGSVLCIVDFYIFGEWDVLCGWLICNVTLTCVMCSFLFCREIVTGTGIAIIGVTAVNVTFVEIGMVLLVMEALLPISEVRSQYSRNIVLLLQITTHRPATIINLFRTIRSWPHAPWLLSSPRRWALL